MKLRSAFFSQALPILAVLLVSHDAAPGQLELKFAQPQAYDMTQTPEEMKLAARLRDLAQSGDEAKMRSFKAGSTLHDPKVVREAGELANALDQEWLTVAEELYAQVKKSRGEAHPLPVIVAKTIALRWMADPNPPGLTSQVKWAEVAWRGMQEMEKSDKVPRPGMLDQLSTLGQLITPLCKLKRYAEAEKYVRLAIPLYEHRQLMAEAVKQARENDANFTPLHQGAFGIGLYHAEYGDPVLAEKWLKQSLEIARLKFMPNFEAMSLGALAQFYASVRDYRKEEPLRLEAYQLRVKTVGEWNSDTIMELGSLAWCYCKLGRYDDAEKAARKAVDSMEHFTPGNEQNRSRVLKPLMVILHQAGKIDEATAIAETVLQKANEPPDQRVDTIFNLGLILADKGKYADAARNFEETYAQWKKSGSPFVQDMRDRALRFLTVAETYLGRMDKARTHAREWAQNFLGRERYILSFTTEDQRHAWMAWQRPFDELASLGLAEETAQMLLWTKGIVLESALEDRRHAQQEGHPEWEELTALRGKIRDSWKVNPPDVKVIAKLEAQADSIEGRLAQGGGRQDTLRRSLRVTVKDLNKSLPAGSALVDYFVYSDRSDPHVRQQGRIGAILHRPGLPPKLFVLPPNAAELDAVVIAFSKAMAAPGAAPRDKDDALESLLRKLQAALLQPMEGDIAKVKTLFICPDGQLSFLPFAALVDAKGRFLCESRDLRYVNSARDLVLSKDAKVKPADKTIALYGGVNYRLGTRTGTRSGGEFLSGLFDALLKERKNPLAPLPGSKREVERLAQRATAAGWKSELHTGDEATETAIRGQRPPGILHIATHGYFIVRVFDQATEDRLSLDTKGDTPARLRTLFNPMDRSGLLLAGAEDSLDLQKRGEPAATENDGILTASECTEMDLRGTWLVTLSACETGAGEARSGEGVFGLRRAILYAGARNVLMSLWPMSDNLAVDFMDDFYGKALATQDAARSLNETQRDWLLRLKKEQGLWSAIKRAGSFILVGTEAR